MHFEGEFELEIWSSHYGDVGVSGPLSYLILASTRLYGERPRRFVKQTPGHTAVRAFPEVTGARGLSGLIHGWLQNLNRWLADGRAVKARAWLEEGGH